MATLGSAFYGSASPSKKRRVAVQEMMQEDEQDSLPIASTSRTPTASPSSARASTSKSRTSPRQKTTPSPSVSPGKFKVHFAGRVYRPLEYTSPKEARAGYTKKGDYIGQPDELVGDDTAVIRCICGKITNENLMIQCDECDAWQHCRCLGYMTEEDCPENYSCQDCAPKDRRRLVNSKDTLDSAITGKSRYEREFTPPSSAKHDASARPSTPQPLDARAKAALSDSDDGLEIEASSPLVDPLSSPGARFSPKKSSAYGSPGSPSSKSSYAASRQLLSQASTSPLVRATSSHPLLTPTKSAKKRLASMALEATTPSPGLDAGSVPLPAHYTALLNLHSAVERAILLHLATEGSRACSTAGLSSAPNEDEFHVDLPNLVTYSTIRLVVERGSGKRFGPTELGQLVWLWEGGLDGPKAAESGDNELGSQQDSKRRGGLSMSVSATKEMDKVSGKKVYTWGLGIDLRIKQNVQLPAFEIVQPPGTPERNRQKELPRSPASTGKLKRHGMSVLPLWSSKAEYRKEEMRRRLGACVVKAHEDFEALGTTSGQASTPSKKVSFAGLPTPPSSHHKRTSLSSPSSTSTGFSRGFILDALPPIPSASLPLLGSAHTSSIKRSMVHSISATIVSVDATIAREESTSEKRKLLEEGALKTDDGPKVSPVKRQMSLLERIKAKEAAQAEVADSSSTSQLPKGGRAAMQSVARSSLELASVRAKKREVRRAL